MENTAAGPAETTGKKMPWYQVWFLVYTRPSRDSFRRILADPAATPRRAILWVAILGFIIALLEVWLLQWLARALFDDRMMLYQVMEMSRGMVFMAPVLVVLNLAIYTAITHGFALLLKGKGKFNELLYCFAAILGPMSVVLALLGMISMALYPGSIPPGVNPAGYIPWHYLVYFLISSWIITIYALVLEVLALDVVEQIGARKAILTVLLPIIIVVGCNTPGLLLSFLINR